MPKVCHNFRAAAAIRGSRFGRNGDLFGFDVVEGVVCLGSQARVDCSDAQFCFGRSAMVKAPQSNLVELADCAPRVRMSHTPFAWDISTCNGAFGGGSRHAWTGSETPHVFSSRLGTQEQCTMNAKYTEELAPMPTRRTSQALRAFDASVSGLVRMAQLPALCFFGCVCLACLSLQDFVGTAMTKRPAAVSRKSPHRCRLPMGPTMIGRSVSKPRAWCTQRSREGRAVEGCKAQPSCGSHFSGPVVSACGWHRCAHKCRVHVWYVVCARGLLERHTFTVADGASARSCDICASGAGGRTPCGRRSGGSGPRIVRQRSCERIGDVVRARLI